MRIFFLSLLLTVLLAVSGRAECGNSVQNALAGFPGTEVPEAAETVRIAVIDTGIDPKRLDGTKLLSGRNYVSGDTGDTVDLVGHGTRIASLILGAGNGEDWIPALAPNAVLIPLVYYSKYPSGVAKNGGIPAICRGISDAVNEFSAEVIVISSGVSEDDPALREAVAAAEERGVIVIAAAGNDGEEQALYPASYDTAVSVASLSAAGTVSAFSQRNAGITVAAPGEDLTVVSLRNGDFFEKCSGTSYACAYVAALAARLIGVHEAMTPKEFREILSVSCTDLPPDGHDSASGYGILNAEAAVRFASLRYGNSPYAGSGFVKHRARGVLPAYSGFLPEMVGVGLRFWEGTFEKVPLRLRSSLGDPPSKLFNLLSNIVGSGFFVFWGFLMGLCADI